MRYVFYGLLGVLFLLVAGVTFVLVAGPGDFVRDRIVEQVKAETGRDLVIAGGSSFTVYPRLGISLADVTLSEPPAMGDRPFARAASIDIAVPLLPLLKRQVTVDRLVLVAPVIELRVDAQGRRNWDFARASGSQRKAEAAPVRLASADGGRGIPLVLAQAAARPAPAARALGNLEQLSLGDVRIQGGTVRYRDERSGAAGQVEKINARLSLPDINGALGLLGDAVYKGEKVDLDGSVGAPLALLEGRASPLKLKLAARPVQSELDGTLKLEPGLDLNGRVKASGASARVLAAWLGSPLPAGPGLGAFAVSGELGVRPQSVALSSATLGLDGMKGRGDVALDTGGPRPLVRGTLALDKLDLNIYRGTSTSGPTPPPAALPAASSGKPTAPIRPGGAAPERSITDLINEASQGAPAASSAGRPPEVRGWSSVPIDVSGLRAVDADLKLTTGHLLVGDVVLDRAKADVALQGGVLKTLLREVILYKGRGSGDLTVDASGGVGKLASNIVVDGVDARPILKSAVGLDKLAGRGRMTLKLASQGLNQQQLAQGLNGTADLAFTDGAIIGINIPGMLRQLQKGQLSGFSTAESEKTDFSELSATFTIVNGVAQNQDLRLVSPLLRMSGAGSVDIARQLVDYTARPKLVASLAGQGGEQNLTGIEIPVRIQGPWDAPRATPDVNALLKDPAAIQKGVQQATDALKGKNAKDVENALKGLLKR
jgi:AsmA protein